MSYRNLLYSLIIMLLILTACDANGLQATPTGGALIPTRIPTLVYTPTPENTATPSNTPTNTATASDTPTNTATLTPSETATASDTPTNTATLTPSETATASDTPTNTATLTPSNTPTDTPTSTPSDTPTPTNTFTPSPTPTPQIVVIDMADEFNFVGNGTIDNVNWRIEYTFTAKANDVVTITMRTDDPKFDPFLILLNPNGELLIENDDARAETDNAVIRDFEILEDGTYTIIATRRGLADSPYVGAFRLEFDRRPGILRGFVPITFDTAKTSSISDEQFFVGYVFVGDEGDTVNITMDTISGDLDPYLVLVNFDTQEEIASNDDNLNEETMNAYLEAVTLPASGVYIILATRYQGADGLSSGEFSILLSNAE